MRYRHTHQQNIISLINEPLIVLGHSFGTTWLPLKLACFASAVHCCRPRKCSRGTITNRPARGQEQLQLVHHIIQTFRAHDLHAIRFDPTQLHLLKTFHRFKVSITDTLPLSPSPRAAPFHSWLRSVCLFSTTRRAARRFLRGGARAQQCCTQWRGDSRDFRKPPGTCYSLDFVDQPVSTLTPCWIRLPRELWIRSMWSSSDQSPCRIAERLALHPYFMRSRRNTRNAGAKLQ